MRSFHSNRVLSSDLFNGLPLIYILSVAATNRLSESVCKRVMLFGDTFSASEAKSNGLVDFVGSSQEEVEQELTRLTGRLRSIGNKELISQVS